MFKNILEKWQRMRAKEKPVERLPVLLDKSKTQLRPSMKTCVVPGLHQATLREASSTA